MMKNLDKRIRDITDIQSITNGTGSYKFLNKKGYFANSIHAFDCLEMGTYYGELLACMDSDWCFLGEFKDTLRTPSNNNFRYFIPEELLKPIEKKYRPYTLKEFIKEYSLGEEVILKRMNSSEKIRHGLFLEYIENNQEVRLGSYWYGFEELVNNYELYTSKGWKPFGIEVEE